jgi:hypothetical protein
MRDEYSLFRRESHELVATVCSAPALSELARTERGHLVLEIYQPSNPHYAPRVRTRGPDGRWAWVETWRRLILLSPHDARPLRSLLGTDWAEFVDVARVLLSRDPLRRLRHWRPSVTIEERIAFGAGEEGAKVRSWTYDGGDFRPGARESPELSHFICWSKRP